MSTNCKIGRVTMKQPDNVIYFPVRDTEPLPASRLLAEAMEMDLETVVVVGFTKDGDFALLQSSPSIATNNFLVDLAKKYIME